MQKIKNENFSRYTHIRGAAFRLPRNFRVLGNSLADCGIQLPPDGIPVPLFRVIPHNSLSRLLKIHPRNKYIFLEDTGNTLETLSTECNDPQLAVDVLFSG